MMNQFRHHLFLAVSLSVIFALASSSSLAHHSHGNYDVRNYTYLEGTVSAVIWLNPHVWVHLDVEDNAGNTTTWALEGGSINEVMQRGWKQDSMQTGDRISARCHALRDGANGCLLGFITPEGGEERVFD